MVAKSAHFSVHHVSVAVQDKNERIFYQIFVEFHKTEDLKERKGRVFT